MYNKIDYKKKIIPKKWFFYDLASDKDQKTLSSLSKNIGVVFFCNYKKKSYIFSKSIKPLLDYCKRNGIVFIIPFSKCLIKEFMALGILFNFKDIILKNKKEILNLKKKFYIVCKVHNYLEAVQIKGVADMIFVSPVFQTTSHPQQKPLKNYMLIYLCHLLKQKLIFALGGMNDNNLKKKKNPYLKGFGGINSFRSTK